MFKVIVTGGKDLTDYNFISAKLDKLFNSSKDVEICISDRRGAEKQAKKYAQNNNLQLKIFNVDWNKGRSAGAKVMTEMFNYADAVVIFDNEEDTYIKKMIDKCKYYHFQKRIIKYESKELWSKKPATDKQMEYIRQIRSKNLHAPIFEGKTVAEAGMYIRRYA